MKRLCGFILSFVWIIISIQAKETTLVIYSTNDMHGSINNFAKIAKFIENERKKYPHTLILNGGDIFSGNPVVDQYPQRGKPMIELMNAVGYQYAAFGNHEFDFGQQALKQCMNQADFEWICANMVVDPSIAVIKQPQPYVTLKMGDIKICILGLIETSKTFQGQPITSAHPDYLKGITFTSPVETITKYKKLREECDLFVGLFHTGYDTDKQIAHLVPELDVIIGGHTHTKIDSTRLINGVLITQTEDELKYIGKTTITFKDKDIVDKQFELIKVEPEMEESNKVNRMLRKFHKEMPLEKALAKATAQFDGKHPLGALMSDAIVEYYHTDFAFQNSGGIRIGMLSKGDVTLADVYKLDPFNNTIIVYKMKPADIRALLKNSHQNNSLSIDLIPSGLKYIIHSHNGKATHITLTDKDGKPLDENKDYKVGMNSYIASSYSIKTTLPRQEMSTQSCDVLIKYLKKEGNIIPHSIPRGTVQEE